MKYIDIYMCQSLTYIHYLHGTTLFSTFFDKTHVLE